MIDFMKLGSVSGEMVALREFWHDQLYENTTEEALRLTVEELKMRDKSLAENFKEGCKIG